MMVSPGQGRECFQGQAVRSQADCCRQAQEAEGQGDPFNMGMRVHTACLQGCRLSLLDDQGGSSSLTPLPRTHKRHGSGRTYIP